MGLLNLSATITGWYACREEIVRYLRKVRSIVPHDLKFVIEDATEGDPLKVGIMW